MTFSTKRKGVPVKRKRGEIDLLQESEKLKNLQQQCHSQLDEKRREIARRNGLLSPEYILTSLTIVQLSVYMPSNREEMLNIDGVTEIKFEQFGDDFLEVSKWSVIYNSGCQGELEFTKWPKILYSFNLSPKVFIPR